MGKGCHSIGFPLISAGIFGYPVEQAWRRALEACADFIGEYGTIIKECGISEEDLSKLSRE